MKKQVLFLKMALLALLVSGSASIASAEEVTVSIPAINAKAGATVELPISVNNDFNVCAFQIDFYYPEGVEYIEIGDLDRINSPAEVNTATGTSGGRKFFRMICVNFQAATTFSSLDKGNGVALTLSIDIAANASPGSYQISLENMQFQPVSSGGASIFFPSNVTSTLTVSNYDFYVNGIYYNKTGTNTVDVTFKDNNFNNYSGNVTIPSSIKVGGVTYKVTGIGDYAFYMCRNLTSVTIPNTVTAIKSCAFEKCSGLTSVAIPNSVTSLGMDAFASCTGLTKVDIPYSVTTIGGLAFYNCTAMTSVVIGSGVTMIEDLAFSGCTALATVTCCSATPPAMKKSTCFDQSTYSNAKLLVPGPVLNTYKSADWWRFFNTVQAASFDFCVNGIYYKKTSSSTVEVICCDAMEPCYSGSVNIPSSIKVGNVTYKVTKIGSYAFYMCRNLTSVTIPTSVTAIDACAFEKCSGLTNVTIPNSVTTLGVDAFSSCTGLKSVDIPNSVTTLNDLAFYNCTAITTATLGTGVKSLGDKVFYGCNALTTVNCAAKNPPTMKNSDCFGANTYNNAVLNVPRSSLNAYKSADWWRKFNIIHGADIGGNPFDIDGDGEVGINDLNTLIDAILNNDKQSRFDVDGDGEVGISDVNSLIDAILNL